MEASFFKEVPTFLILAGTITMIVSIRKTQNLLLLFPPEHIPRNWKILYSLMIMFLGGYSLAAWLTWEQNTNLVTLLTGMVFFGGSFFVLFSVTTYHQTLQHLIHSKQELSQAKQWAEESLARLQQVPTLIQTEKMAGLGQMVAGVAHEINNPINFIHANIHPAKNYIHDLIKLIDLYQEVLPHPNLKVEHYRQVIDFDFLREDVSRLLNSMENGSQRITTIVSSLKHFSRMNEAVIKSVDLHQGLDSTLIILEHRLRAHGHRSPIQVIRRYGDIPSITCYAGEINQVFMNILVNAIDALEEAMVNQNLQDAYIEIETRCHQQWIQVVIRDNGIGIPTDVQKKLFDPFFTTKAVGKGTGLGLSISYQIITQKHSGYLKCDSKPGKTEFIIELPCNEFEQLIAV
ncbi:sensor histidine kinase [Leptolyngbya sp. PCC 6406]|uniref:sensor histidine kinase n=1 Tax=Leptolyngbya sp. PCC 6406 TaxID=1173264 RepID=UPI0002ACCC32|nr:ATP-binding protein [Leptolyngbya sp. PCC 6406]